MFDYEFEDFQIVNYQHHPADQGAGSRLKNRAV
jgi:thymidylate synthase